MRISSLDELSGSPEQIESAAGLTPEVDNRLYDLLIQDEELQAAAQRTHDNVQHIREKLSQLEEGHPAREPLIELVGSGFFHKEFQGSMGYRNALEKIDDLNNHRFMNEMEWMITLAGFTFIPLGAAGATIALTGFTAGRATLNAAYDVNDARQAVNHCLELSSEVEKTRQDFDAAFARLVEDEQPEDLPEL